MDEIERYRVETRDMSNDDLSDRLSMLRVRCAVGLQPEWKLEIVENEWNRRAQVKAALKKSEADYYRDSAATLSGLGKALGY